MLKGFRHVQDSDLTDVKSWEELLKKRWYKCEILCQSKQHEISTAETIRSTAANSQRREGERLILGEKGRRSEGLVSSLLVGFWLVHEEPHTSIGSLLCLTNFLGYQRSDKK
jgi:hypothetical protein